MVSTAHACDVGVSPALARCTNKFESRRIQTAHRRRAERTTSPSSEAKSVASGTASATGGMSWDFFVPVCVGDLVKTGGINQYVVQDVVSPKQLPSHLSKFKAALRSKGPLCVLEHFDTGYSVLQHCNSVELGVKEDTLESLIQVVSGLAASLPALLLSTSISAAERKEKLNAVKMSVYLLCKLTETLESDSCRQSIITAPGKGGKKGKAGGEGLLQWDSERERVLQALIQLLQLDIRSLWNLSLVEGRVYQLCDLLLLQTT
ncbi:Condensin complex subunit 1 [Larimichthys crocea]|uniref:Uncharacterized protein n=1 Tax=Larimichthys crocea TaxID=215358 RepID=A0ACD3QTW6_LARCR|nr:Condensin complex subunit 1 [Larimichthys crocea]